MRELLEAFRLPGESSPIGRITEVFAEHFFSYRPGELGTPVALQLANRSSFSTVEVQSQDAAYVLAYSVIMLNTDQHNPQNRVSSSAGARSDAVQPLTLGELQKRMTIEDYQRNLRGVNDGKDFSPEYLVSQCRCVGRSEKSLTPYLVRRASMIRFADGK